MLEYYAARLKMSAKKFFARFICGLALLVLIFFVACTFIVDFWVALGCFVGMPVVAGLLVWAVENAK